MMGTMKTGLVFVVTLALVIVGVFLFTHFTNLETSDLDQANLTEKLMPWRIGAYVLILAAWKPISRFLTRPRVHRDQITDEVRDKWDELSHLFARSWWKLALFFTGFELFVIQQVGFMP